MEFISICSFNELAKVLFSSSEIIKTRLFSFNAIKVESLFVLSSSCLAFIIKFRTHGFSYSFTTVDFLLIPLLFLSTSIISAKVALAKDEGSKSISKPNVSVVSTISSVALIESRFKSSKSFKSKSKLSTGKPVISAIFAKRTSSSFVFSVSLSK